MISRRQIRRLLAPTSRLRRSLAFTVIGFLAFGAGFTLSFRRILLPTLEGASGIGENLMGLMVPADSVETAAHLVGGALLVVGSYFLFTGVRSLLRNFVNTLTPGVGVNMADAYVRRMQLQHGPRIVALGGGTGLSTLLRGLKQHSSNITAVVTVTDDGGSSGRLMQEMDIIPPGDIRNCLVALADAEKLMTDLFQHRFRTARGALSGHSLGNLLLAGLVDQCGGDFERALNMASEVLNIRGRVVPSTLEKVRLRALMENGMEVCGETKIVESHLRIRRVFIEPEDAEPYQEAIEAIRQAELICIGPGSIYTSVIPNLLVPGIAEAIRESSAVKVYVCNVMTQPGESDSFTAAEHLVALQANVEQRICDYVLVNTDAPSPAIIERYREQNQHLVQADIDRIRTMGYKVITGNYMSESAVVRHDPLRVAGRLISLLG